MLWITTSVPFQASVAAFPRSAQLKVQGVKRMKVIGLEFLAQVVNYL